ncbi:hypothetical protein [Natronococcus wangiae]|uniref:hypothetical protein n=1 Tax=Natronococcus wangiae TaxID=3068275 RepID=UPI00273D5BC2|nr:hypothetical protein [Natronococcus sp. AD5]
MTSLDEIIERLDRVEDRVEESPGAAQDDLESVITDLGEVIAGRQDRANALLHNEDFPGAAQLLGENALAMQRASVITLELREQIRRRR